MKKVISKSAEETRKIGNNFARNLQGGSVVCLHGDLGAGKTTFTQGLAEGLGIKSRIISPTFVIVRNYKIKDNKLKIKDLYHIDLYRIEDVKGLEGLGLEDIFDDDNAITIIEWAERLGAKMPDKRTDIYFENINDLEREITVNP